LLHLPDFIQPRQAAQAAAATPTQARSSPPLPPRVDVVKSTPAPITENHAKVESQVDGPAKRLICANCGIKITYPEGKFCWNNAKRFGGMAYCREHQTLISMVA
jgi:hypothetical protein